MTAAAPLGRRLPSRVSLLSLSEAASPVMSTHAIFGAFVSGRSTPVTTTGSASAGMLMTSTASMRGASPPPMPRSPAATPPLCFGTAYFGTRPTAEAFAQYRAHRVKDASLRLRNVEVAAMRRAARLRQVRTQQHAAESHRQYVARRVFERLQAVQRKIDERLALAEQRRCTVIEKRVEAQRKAEARRAAVRERLQVLKRAGEVVRSADCRSACEAIVPLTLAVEATMRQAAQLSAEHGSALDSAVLLGAPVGFPNTMHGRYAFHSSLEKVEGLLIADGRKVLPGAASDVLDILLTAADLSSADSPQNSPERKSSTSRRHVDPELAGPRWAVLHDPEYRLKAAMLLIAAHHSAIEVLAPGRTEPVWATSSGAVTMVHRFCHLVRCAVEDPSAEATDLHSPIGGFQVREFLSCVVDFVEATTASKAARQADMVRELTQALVQLRVGEAVRQRDIQRTKNRAAAAGENSAEARRERQVVPRRAVLTSAVASQIDKVLRRLRAVGGDDAVRIADCASMEAIAALPPPQE